jgi:hypothetical protein
MRALSGCSRVGDGFCDEGEPDLVVHHLIAWILRWAIVVAIDFVWSFSYTIWPRKAKA